MKNQYESKEELAHDAADLESRARRGMRVLYFKSENFKRLSVVEIRPDGNLIPIRGLNEQGKTSVLDSLWVALKGKAVAPPAPIRRGQEMARIVLELGEEQCEYRVTRTFQLAHDEGKAPWDYTTELRITDAEGLPVKKSPQALLDSFVGALTFDPLEFLRMKPEEQFDLLGRMFVPGVDFKKLERQYDADYEKRADINKRAREAKAFADVMVVPDEPPGKRVDKSALVQKLRSAVDHNADIEQRKANRDRLAADATSKRTTAQGKISRAEELRRQAEALESEAKALFEHADNIEQALAQAEPLPEPIDTAILAAQIEAADKLNESIDQWEKDHEKKRERLALWRALEKEAKDLTAAMEAREREKEAKIAAAKMPVEGLGFGKGIVLFNGIPLQQAADSVQLRTSIAIGMAMNPVLKILCIRNGNLLDRNNLKIVEDMAREHGYDVWIELVGDEGETGFILEDGHLKDHAAQVAP